MAIKLHDDAKGADDDAGRYRIALGRLLLRDRTEVLPTATREDLLTGREVADIGQCCPTSFTTGNLANYLRGKAKDLGVAVLSEDEWFDLVGHSRS